jgi:peptide/nickel transport system permease protein
MSFDDTHVFGIRTDLLNRIISVLKRDWKAQLGAIIVFLFGMMAVLAPEIAPYDPMAAEHPLFRSPDIIGPHPLGTDTFGRDILSRVMLGARISLSIGVLSVMIGAVLGTLVGLIAGYFGGWIDDTLMRIIDILWAFPYLLIALLFVAIFGRGYWNVVFALGFAYIDDFARIIRSEVLAIREEEYILAARMVGLKDRQIIFEQVVPNTVAPFIVMFTILVARAMIGEATLSFLGLGVKSTTPTWGAMLGQGRNVIATAWWISVIPGLFIMVTVLGINLFGDALRDAFDVREEEA